MSFEASTIIALATACQSAGVGIIRLSGPASLSVFKALFKTPKGATPSQAQERHAYFGKIFSTSGDFLDDAIALYFKAPRSFTGEDILEFHCHGNPLLLREIMQNILSLKDLNLRYAEAGEFSRRAFLNHKMDLTEVEALQGLIMADSLASLKSHRFNLSGRLSGKVNELKERLVLSLALVEASFEFPDEDIQTYNPMAVFDELKEIKTSLLELVQSYSNCKVFDQGIKVALLGEPNVGKSSLLNALLQEDRAIVSPLAGTTRDVIYGARQIMDLKFHFSDTAGLRQTRDEIESLGIERSHVEAKRADIVLYLTDNPEFRERPLFSSAKHYYILTKSDLLDKESLEINKPFFDFTLTVMDFEVVDNIMKKICTDFNSQSVQIDFHVNTRQHDIISSALESVQNLISNWTSLSSTEILSEELRFIIRNLQEITGLVTSDAVLGEIFKRFCIGK